MRKLMLLLVLAGLFTQSPLFAQNDSIPLFKRKNSYEPAYLKKIEKYRKMRNTGITLGIIGVACTVTGVVMISNATWYNQTSTSIATNDSKGLIGILAVLVGVPLTATGSVLGGIGASKMKKYTRKLEGVSLNLHYTPQQQGFSLTYRF